MKTTHSMAFLFVVAFVLNALWEFWHAQFYEHYQGGAITVFVLLRAAMIDAVIITTTIFIAIVARRFLIFSYSRELAHEQLEHQYSTRALWFAVPAWFIVAVFLEKWALSTHRWVYSDMMPIIPFVGTGLTPTIQLALLGTVSWFITHAICSRR